MIQGNIEAHLGESRYRVAISYDTNRAQARITALNAEITAANAALAQLQSELSNVQADIDALKTANNVLADTIASGVDTEQLPTYQKAYQQNLEILGGLSNQAQNLKFQINQLKAQTASAQKQITFIEAHQGGDETITAWSNEYNEDLTGVVAVELIGGLKGYPVIVASESVNGRLSRAISVKREHCFSNLALLTGWLKWQQKHLIGVVQSVGDSVSASVAGINHPQSLIGSVQPFDRNSFSSATDYPYETGDLALIEANNNGLQSFKGWYKRPRIMQSNEILWFDSNKPLALAESYGLAPPLLVDGSVYGLDANYEEYFYSQTPEEKILADFPNYTGQELSFNSLGNTFKGFTVSSITLDPNNETLELNYLGGAGSGQTVVNSGLNLSYQNVFGLNVTQFIGLMDYALASYSPVIPVSTVINNFQSYQTYHDPNYYGSNDSKLTTNNLGVYTLGAYCAVIVKIPVHTAFIYENAVESENQLTRYAGFLFDSNMNFLKQLGHGFESVGSDVRIFELTEN